MRARGLWAGLSMLIQGKATCSGGHLNQFLASIVCLMFFFEFFHCLFVSVQPIIWLVKNFIVIFCHVRSKTERIQVRLLLIPYFLPFSVGSNIEFRNLLTHFVSLNSSFLKWYLRISKIITILQSHQANSVEQSLHNKRSGRLLTNLHF